MSQNSATDRVDGVQKRESARERARSIQEQQRKVATRNRAVVISSIGVVAALIVVAIVLIFGSMSKPGGIGPKNMASDGIVIGKEYVAVRTPGLQIDEQPVASSATPGVADIRVYFDYMCPFCGQFEQANSDQLDGWVKSGLATVEYHPLALFDRASNGTRYSTRAANAAACVANYSPDQFWNFNSLLMTHQPAEATPGLDNTALKDLANASGALEATQIDSCIDNATFSGWAADATARALESAIPGTEEKLKGTPLVIVNGSAYAGAPSDAGAFAAFLEQRLAH